MDDCDPSIACNRYMSKHGHGTELDRPSFDEAAAFVSIDLRAILSIMSSFCALFWSKKAMRASVKAPVDHSCKHVKQRSSKDRTIMKPTSSDDVRRDSKCSRDYYL